MGKGGFVGLSLGRVLCSCLGLICADGGEINGRGGDLEMGGDSGGRDSLFRGGGDGRGARLEGWEVDGGTGKLKGLVFFILSNRTISCSTLKKRMLLRLPIVRKFNSDRLRVVSGVSLSGLESIR